MDYEQIMQWCEEKIKNKKRRETTEIKGVFPLIAFNDEIDAVRELVLECCPKVGKSLLSEINLLNNEDMLRAEKKFNEMKASYENKINNAVESLQKAYDNIRWFCSKLDKEIAEVKVGRKGILDLEEDLKFCHPQTFDFYQCAEALGRNLQEKLEM